MRRKLQGLMAARQSARNYFELFDLPVGMEIDTEKLTARYRDLQRVLHPDRYAHAPDHERRVAMQRAAEVNDGYRTLRDPAARARYILELRGVLRDDAAATLHDPEFIEEQIELRETLAEIDASADVGRELERFRGQVMMRQRECLEALRQALAGDSPADLQRGQRQVYRLQFLQRLLEEVETRTEDMD